MTITAESRGVMADLERVATDFVNEVRATFGADPILALPSGVPERADSCPVARGIRSGTHFGALVTGTNVWVTFGKDWLAQSESQTRHFFIPERVREFIGLFDNGGYPELVEDA